MPKSQRQQRQPQVAPPPQPQLPPPPEPAPEGPAAYQAIEPVSPDHVMSWKTTTSGLEDYANWRLTLKDEKLDGDPPFRRGRIWA